MSERVAARRLVLASASPARLRLLQSAGFAPDVIVSGVDEDAVEAQDVGGLALLLAEQKARAVSAMPEAADAIVIGCDTLLEFKARAFGKPATPEQARDAWRAMRGYAGTLITGHCVIDTRVEREASATCRTVVHFGNPTEEEIDALVATGEPMRVAGAFTIDGRSAPFIEGLEGDHGNVIGISIPLFRQLLAELGIEVTSLWT